MKQKKKVCDETVNKKRNESKHAKTKSKGTKTKKTIREKCGMCSEIVYEPLIWILLIKRRQTSGTENAKYFYDFVEYVTYHVLNDGAELKRNDSS